MPRKTVRRDHPQAPRAVASMRPRPDAAENARLVFFLQQQELLQ